MANKTKPRLAFNFLRSYYDVLDDIPSDTEKLEYLMAILNRQFKGIEPTFIGVMSKALYKSQRHSIEKSIEGWESKTGQQLYQPTQDPSVGPTQGPCQDPYQQEEEKEQVKEEVQVKAQIEEKVEKEIKERKRVIRNLNKDISRIVKDNNVLIDKLDKENFELLLENWPYFNRSEDTRSILYEFILEDKLSIIEDNIGRKMTTDEKEIVSNIKRLHSISQSVK